VLDSATISHHASSLTNCHTINLTSISANNSLATITPTTICINKNVNNSNQISIEKLTNSINTNNNNNNNNNNNHIIHLNNIKTEHMVDQNNQLFYNNSANNADSKFLINWTNNQAPIANTVKITANAQPNDKSSTIKQVSFVTEKF
jgi:hypothetical protein